MTTQEQIDALKVTAATLTAQVNALTPDVTTPPVANPTITGFAATPGTITAGHSTVLDAIVANAISLTLDGTPVTLPVTVTPTADHTYTLQATGAPGTRPAVALAGVVVNAVVTTPPPSGELIPVKGPRQISMQLSWMADFIPKSALTPREVPWTILPDPATGFLAKPMNGKNPARVRVWNHLGTIQGLYSHYPEFGPDGMSAPYESNVGSDIAAIANDLRRRPRPYGKRGIAYLTPYCSVHDHPATRPDGTINPRMPLWLCLDHAGNLYFWMADGSLQYAGHIPGINYCTVFAIDEIALTTFYVCDFGVPDMGTPSKFTKSRIAKVERATGRQTATKPENASEYVVTTFYDMPNGLPVSVRTDEEVNVYVADNLSGKLTKITPQGVVSTVATVPGVVAMAYDAGKLVCVVNTSEVKVVDIATGTVGPNINLIPGQVTGPSAPYGGKFWSISIDRNGTFGIKGTIAVTRDIGGGNLDCWFWEPDVTSPVGYKNATWHGGQGWDRVGDFLTVGETFGHYPWAAEFHRHQALMAVSGVSGQFQMLVAYATANEVPPQKPFNKYKWEFGVRGAKVWSKGGVKASPFNKPSLCCITTKEGWSPFKDCSFDEMAERSFDSCEAFVQGGLIGQFRRDDIVGEDLYCVLQMIYANSQRHLREGQALLDQLDAWWVSKGRTVPPSILSSGDPITVFGAEEGIYAQAKADGSGVEMWRRDYKDPAIPVPAGAVVVVDEGTPFESTELTPGDHALTVRGAGMTRAIVVRKA